MVQHVTSGGMIPGESGRGSRAWDDDRCDDPPPLPKKKKRSQTRCEQAFRAREGKPLTKQITLNVPIADYKLLRDHAIRLESEREEKVGVGKVCKEQLAPLLQELRLKAG